MSSRREQINLQPKVLRWARRRNDLSLEDLASKLRVKPERVRDWEHTGNISIAQIDRLAARTYTPLGFLYLSEPPDERLPIADFRVQSGESSPPPSPELLETVYLMQRRQWWMQEELRHIDAHPVEFVGSCALQTSSEATAARMRVALGLPEDWARQESSWTHALTRLRHAVEAAGVLVVINGVVQNNTRRKLNRDEFQGFALADNYAPLIFVNGADFKTAQIFTLIHELAHLMVARSGVSRWEKMPPIPHAVERFCDKATAEFLVPAEQFLTVWKAIDQRKDPYQTLAQRFRVSRLVAVRRALDLKLIDQNAFRAIYPHCLKPPVSNKGQSGGDFWTAQKSRIGLRLASAVVRAVQEGRLPHREAYALTGLRDATFAALADKLEITL